MYSGHSTESLDQCRVTLNPTVGRVCAPQKARGRSRSHSFNSLLVATLCWLACSAAYADTPLTLVLNWVPGADHAPFFYALRQGWYAAAGIALSVDSVAGSPEAIKRAVQAPGTLAVADFVSYLRARTSFPGATAVMALQPLSPYAVYFSAASGITRAQDLAGKRIAVQPQDPMRRLWRPLAQRNATATDAVTWVDRSNAEKPDALARRRGRCRFQPVPPQPSQLRRGPGP